MDDLRYRCLHCGADLGAYVEGGDEPSCVDHPDGTVQIVRRVPDPEA